MTNSVRVHRNFIDVQGAHGPALSYTIDSFQLHISLWFLVGTSNCVWHANKLHSKHKFCIFSLPQLAVFLKTYLVFLYVCKCFIWKKIHKIPWNWSFRQLWATTCWCWKLKLYLLQKHQEFLNTELSSHHRVVGCCSQLLSSTYVNILTIKMCASYSLRSIKTLMWISNQFPIVLRSIP